MAAITVRRPTFDLTDLPRHFFIDAVKAFRDRIDDDRRKDVTAFIGQEAVHSRIHQTTWDQLRAHGVPIDRYATLIESLRGALDPMVPAKLQLAITSALEHYTAVYGHAFLTEDLDDVLAPEMAALLRWHGAEEIEHRAVAFDVLQDVDDSWWLRTAGFAVATTLLTAVPAAGVAIFAAADLRQRRLRFPRLPDRRLLSMTTRFLGRASRETIRYVHPSFHPGAAPEPDDYLEWAERA